MTAEKQINVLTRENLPETAKISTDEYGFRNLMVTPKDGGRISISHYGGESDIGYISSINKHGMGGSEYVRNLDDINNHSKGFMRTVWLNAEEISTLILFLESFRTVPVVK